MRLDMPTRRLDLLVDDEELQLRRNQWNPRPSRYITGVLGKYAPLVGPPAYGAICHRLAADALELGDGGGQAADDLQCVRGEQAVFTQVKPLRARP
ncbi:hypothetical protein ACFZAV_21685 [Streptomyces sp. NPDC008343]|uniref:hypothetical protein n=1 Tax=Streptomyces sp. NPDC008343 TaxID=3364828 RepID=UPI0036EB9AD0